MKKIITLTAIIALTLTAFPLAYAPSQSIIVIAPQWPLAVSTPATFSISTTPAADPTYDPWFLLAMTVQCYDGLTNVVIEDSDGNTVTFTKSDFTLLTGDPPPQIPDSSISERQYTRANLADHLGVTGDVYWAMKPFPPGTILHETAQSFTVTVHSTAPCMTLYVLGKSTPTAPKFDRWVPPTNPGFVVPELGTILLAMASFGALALFAAAKRKKALFWK
ncbi:MAG: hypothetical protein ACQXXH_01535 [Candidatus Bathyarchaeia archaeon]|jgi:hypothetical protein|nr:hypothetical protein [Candidatus Bathyarchaeota archaeon A05DMB-4]MDH7596083.1 hypothetical protein [Candidatus Bathyarchaeota archaeon]